MSAASRVMGVALEYERYRAKGDVVMAGACRRTLDDLAGYWLDGLWVYPQPIAAAMGRPELGAIGALAQRRMAEASRA